MAPPPRKAPRSRRTGPRVTWCPRPRSGPHRLPPRRNGRRPEVDEPAVRCQWADQQAPRKGGPIGTVTEVLRAPDVRRIELGWGLSVIGELAGTVSLVVYAYGEGGATLVAAYAVARTVAGIAVGLLFTGVGDRVRRDRLLRLVTGLRAVLLASAALVAAQ